MRIGSLFRRKAYELRKVSKGTVQKAFQKAAKRIPTCRASVIMGNSKYSKKERHAWKASGTAYLG